MSIEESVNFLIPNAAQAQPLISFLTSPPPDTPQHFIFYSPQAGGKSHLIRDISTRTLFNIYHTPGGRDNNISKWSGEEWYNKDTIAVTEDHSTFSRLTRGDPIFSRKLYENVVKRIPRCNVILMTNTLPSTRYIQRRKATLIEFPHIFPGYLQDIAELVEQTSSLLLLPDLASLVRGYVS